MTPDLKRLCEAAERASARDDIELTGEEVEAIVRAVLTALREPSLEIEVAGGREEIAMGCGEEDYNAEIGSYGAGKAFTAMIDAILAEPATA